jgi:heparanase 1
MNSRVSSVGWRRFPALGALALSAAGLGAQQKPSLAVAPSAMPALSTVDLRFLSYNVEMVEVTGGRFWKPYQSSSVDAAKPNSSSDTNQPVGVNPNLYRYRPPINLSNPRLRKLAAALGPVYLRVSGTWQNSTYFQDDDEPALKQPPKGFNSILTRAQWKAVVDFAREVGAEIVTSAAISPGTRDADGVWTPVQAKAFFDYTRSLGGSIAAVEFMNEPTFAMMGGAPQGYDATVFARDAKIFAAFLRKESPGTIFLGPGSVGEGISLGPAGMKLKLITTDDLMQATGPIFDAFSYHFYGSVSRRCGGSVKIDRALSADWLDRTDTVEAFYAALRDKYLPGKPLWLTETGEAACGGDPFAGQFADSFRFLNQLGTLAQKGVKSVMHNTLAASDYGLLTEDTLEPKPNYWAALLWSRTMGPVVLDPGVSRDEGLRIYAHCMKGTKGGVAVLALNTDNSSEQAINLPLAADRYSLTAADLASRAVLLNGTGLQAASDGSVPELKGQPVKAGTLRVAPASISFLTLPSARNKACM